jgi:hypothetical protein
MQRPTGNSDPGIALLSGEKTYKIGWFAEKDVIYRNRLRLPKPSNASSQCDCRRFINATLAKATY